MRLEAGEHAMVIKQLIIGAHRRDFGIDRLMDGIHQVPVIAEFNEGRDGFPMVDRYLFNFRIAGKRIVTVGAKVAVGLTGDYR